MSVRHSIHRWSKAGDPAWQIRRRLTGYTLGFCALTTLLAMFGFTSDALAPTVVTSNYALAGAIIAAYLGAATTDDIYKRKDSSEGPGA